MLEFDCNGVKVEREERYTSCYANVCLSLSYMELRFKLFELWFAWGHVNVVRVVRVMIKNL